jgi:hypothetical protein
MGSSERGGRPSGWNRSTWDEVIERAERRVIVTVHSGSADSVSPPTAIT